MDNVGSITLSAALERIVWNQDGLAPAIAQDAVSGQVLMLAWMNREALELTLATGRVTYWSRSRGEIWRKGDTSGHIQTLVSLHVDCDADAILVQVRQTGPACHTGEKSCFFTRVQEAG